MNPSTTQTPYCSAATLLVYHRWEDVADRVRDGDGERPTKGNLVDPQTVEGQIVLACLLAASGELESACQVGLRYTPADLQSLTGAGKARLEQLVANLAFWAMAQRSQPGSADPKQVPGALQALEELDRLRNGVRIFPFVDAADAGNPSTTGPADSSRQVSIVTQASRYFGGHGRTGRQ